MWAKIITIKRTKDLNYFSLCALNLFKTRVSQFELNYWNKLTFPWHSSLLRCTCIISLLDGPPLELPVRWDLLSQAGGLIFQPQPELWKLWAWPLRGTSSYAGLLTEIVETILHSRAPSTRKHYVLKWKVFTSWCSDHQLDPVNCSVGTVLEFMQERFIAGLAPSTLKVYVVAISAYHIPLGGMSLGKDPQASHFLRGTLRLRCCKPYVLLLFRMRTRKGTICFAQRRH